MSRRKRSPGSSDDEFRDCNKRQIKEDDVQETLSNLIYELGDKDLYKLPSELQSVATVIKKDLTILRREILEVLVNCAQNIPEKLTIYVTLIGLVNSKDYSLGEEFVELLLKHFKDAIKNGNHEDTKFLLRFMSDLININVINPASIMTLYNVLINQTLEENTTQLCKDWLIYVVLYSLPWSVAKLATQCHADLDKLLHNIDSYIEKRPADHLGILPVWTSSDHQAQEDYIDCLWNQLKNMRMQGWREKVLWRLYNDPSLSILVQQSRPHKLPQLSLTLSLSVYPLPRVIFRLFDYTDVIEDELQSSKAEAIPSLDEQNNNVDIPESKVLEAMDTNEAKPAVEQLILPGSHSIERYLIEEQYRIIINGFKTNRKLCATALIALPMRVRLAVSYMIVETVLGEMFQLPKSDQTHLYYTALLIELCREAPNSIPLVLAQATEMLFDRIESMRTICIERFVCWFSHHLSNFKFQWSWSDWAYCIQDALDKPKTRFIAEVLQRLLRFSYFEYVTKIVPAEFARLLPKPPGAVNKYGEGAPKSLPCQKVAQKLTQMIKNHHRSDELITFLKEIADERAVVIKVEPSNDNGIKDEAKVVVVAGDPEPSKDDGDNADSVMEMETENYEDDKNESPPMEVVKPDYQLYPGVTRRVLDVLMTSLLNIGSKTFTHAFMFIEKYHKVIKAFVTCEQDVVEVLHCLFGVWQEQRQMMVVLTEKLIEKEIVEPMAVIYWVFSDEMFSQINCFYVWEIIAGILDTASLAENDAWNHLQDIEDTNESEAAKEDVKRSYAQARKRYMDLVIQSLAGIVLRLKRGSTSHSATKTRGSLDLVDHLMHVPIDLTTVDGVPINGGPITEETPGNLDGVVPDSPVTCVSNDTRAWLLGRVENLLLTVDLPHNYVLKQVDRFISKIDKISLPDQFLEIYGVYRVTVNQAS